MAALGLNVVVGYAGLLDLGFVAFWAIGGYTAGWLMSDRSSGAELPLPRPRSSPATTTSPASTSTSGSCWSSPRCSARCSGVIIGAPTLRLRSDYLALVTLGFGEIIPQIFHNGDDIAGFNLTNGTQGISRWTRCGSSPSTGPAQLVWGDLDTVRRPAAVLHLLRAGRGGHLRLAADPRGPARPGLAGHPRGRAGRERDGRSADADQAARVRGRCGRRRHRRGGVRGARRGGAAGPVPVRHLDHVCWPWSCSAAWATSGASPSARSCWPGPTRPRCRTSRAALERVRLRATPSGVVLAVLGRRRAGRPASDLIREAAGRACS